MTVTEVLEEKTLLEKNLIKENEASFEELFENFDKVEKILINLEAKFEENKIKKENLLQEFEEKKQNLGSVLISLKNINTNFKKIDEEKEKIKKEHNEKISLMDKEINEDENIKSILKKNISSKQMEIDLQKAQFNFITCQESQNLLIDIDINKLIEKYSEYFKDFIFSLEKLKCLNIFVEYELDLEMINKLESILTSNKVCMKSYQEGNIIQKKFFYQFDEMMNVLSKKYKELNKMKQDKVEKNENLQEEFNFDNNLTPIYIIEIQKKPSKKRMNYLLEILKKKEEEKKFLEKTLTETLKKKKI